MRRRSGWLLTTAVSIKSGTVLIQSGIATDGVILPLPPGVTAEQVGPGKLALHIQVNPFVTEQAIPDDAALIAAIPLECVVDQNRRVRCRVRLLFIKVPSGSLQSVDTAGACRYTIMAAAPATGVISP